MAELDSFGNAPDNSIPDTNLVNILFDLNSISWTSCSVHNVKHLEANSSRATFKNFDWIISIY